MCLPDFEILAFTIPNFVPIYQPSIYQSFVQKTRDLFAKIVCFLPSFAQNDELLEYPTLLLFFFFIFFFLFMSDAHHGINSSTQKYQSTPSSVVLTSCRQDSGSPPF